MRVLMTGSTGAIGLPLLAKLLARGDSVTALVHPKPNRKISEHDGLRIVYGDVTDENIFGALRQHAPFDVVYHVAGKVQYHESQRDETFRTNVFGTRNMLRIAEALEVERFVYPSTCYVGGDKLHLSEDETGDIRAAHNPYEASKIEAEELVKNYLGNALIARLSTVVGDAATGKIERIGGFSGFAGSIYNVHKWVSGFSRNPFLVAVNPNSSMNLLPREWSIDLLVNAGYSTLGGTIHISHPNPVPMDWLFEETFHRGLNLPVTFDRTICELTAMRQDRRWQKIQHVLEESVNYFGSYVQRDTLYGHERVRMVPGYTPPPEITSDIIQAQLRYMKDTFFAPKSSRLAEVAA